MFVATKRKKTGKIDKLTKILGKLNPSDILTKEEVREDLERHLRAMHLFVGFGRASENPTGGLQRASAIWRALLERNAWKLRNVSTKLVRDIRNL